MSFPYTMYRLADEAAPELIAGWHVKIGKEFYKILKKRPWKVAHTYTVNLGAVLNVDYVDNESANLNPGTGQVNRKGYSGLLKGADMILRQTKLVAFGTIQPVDIFWKREPYPRDATVSFTSLTVPVTSPLILQRFSYDSSMLFEFRATGAGPAMTIYLEMVEYEIEDIVLASGDIYREIYIDGFMSEPKKVA